MSMEGRYSARSQEGGANMAWIMVKRCHEKNTEFTLVRMLLSGVVTAADVEDAKEIEYSSI